VIDLVEVSHSYGGTQRVIDGVSFTVARGSLTAIAGPSGRGKSTLLFIAGLLLTPDSGEVLVDGVRASGLSDRRRSALRGGTISFVFQDAMLDTTRTVLANVLEPTEYGATRVGRDRDRALGLLHQLGVDVDPNRRPGQISGGQGQRVAMCRALLPRPAVILADEPTGNLDKASAEVVLRTLQAEAERGTAVAVATHDERVIGACHTVVRLR
jgi:ABC-type lipoprotein export system ATPase subunit